MLCVHVSGAVGCINGYGGLQEALKAVQAAARLAT